MSTLRLIGLWALGTLGTTTVLAVSILVPVTREVSRDLTEIKAGVANFNTRLDIQRQKLEKIEDHQAKDSERIEALERHR